MSDFFQEAYRRARNRHTQEQWLALAPQQITDEIYREMRQMDAAAAPIQVDPAPRRRGRRNDSSALPS
ncbi:MAG TPA: hypothetical protein VGG99_25550 [Acetobacteraceae bacterium]|jgi:hypothetical protein